MQQAAWELAQARLQRDSSSRVAGGSSPIINNWRTWALTVFPGYFQDNFGERHERFWALVEQIGAAEDEAEPLPAIVAIWPRGSGKSTTTEGAVVRLAAKGARRYCWYVSGTQDQADKHVATIAGMLESRQVERYHPELANRLLGKNGNSRGWNRNLLRCASGFTLEAIGLNKAIRGGKMDWARPDLIVFDDVDDREDSPEGVAKKIRTITDSILPAGSSDVAVIFVQNLIHVNSIASMLAGVADEPADFLYHRVVLGPYPAVEGLTVEQTERGFQITGGAATWAGQSLRVCAEQINKWGLGAFRREAQHEVSDPPGGMFDHLAYRRCAWDAVPDLVRVVVWVDPAVTSTDKSDAMGIQADGIAADGTIYRLWSWETITSPEDCLRRALLKAIELTAEAVGVETDQGGDTWKSVYERVWEKLVDELVSERLEALVAALPDGTTDEARAQVRDEMRAVVKAALLAETPKPRFRSAKAGEGHGSKVHRAGLMLVDYEQGKIVHVMGTHGTLERALNRFPKTKPYDLTDAAYWGWADLRGRGGGSRILFAA